jgi:hypothetical protein
MIEFMHAAHRRGVLCLAASLFLSAAACAKGAPQTQPATGRVTVGVTSRGPGVQTMTFTVSIEPAGVNGSVRADAGVFTAENTPAGSHVVRLKNLPGGCRVDGDTERQISVSARRSAIVRFVVVCS